MNDVTRQAACDAFNLLQQNQAIHPDALYQLVENANRGRVLNSIRDFCEVPSGYSRLREYVMLWRPSPDAPFGDLIFIEVHEFIGLSARLQLRAEGIIHEPERV